MVLGSAPLPAGSSCLLASLWSSCRSVCHWVNLGNTPLMTLAFLKRPHAILNAPMQLFVSIVRTRLELPGFSVLYQVVSQRLHVRPLSNFLDCLRRLLTSPLSVRVKRFSVNERVVKERAAAAARGSSSSSCWHQRWRTFLQVHVTRGEMEQLEFDKFRNW